MTTPTSSGVPDGQADDWRSLFLRILLNDALHRPDRVPPAPRPYTVRRQAVASGDESPYAQEDYDEIVYPPAPQQVVARRHGFVAIATGTASLQHVQQLCAETSDVCLTARYDLGDAPAPGSLFAAFAADLATTRVEQPIGRFLPQLGPERSPWDSLRYALADQDGARINFIGQPAGGDLRGSWLDRFLEAVGDVDTLAGGTRLYGSPEPRVVLFAEVTNSSRLFDRDAAMLRALARRLPEAVGLVISAPDNFMPNLIVDPGFAYLAVDQPDLPGRRAADYVEVPLTGDQVAETDALGRSGYATALATLVMLPGTGPMTIGIHAPWGMGKSSFMRFVEQRLVEFGLVRRRRFQWPLHDFRARLGPSAAEQLLLATATEAGQPALPIRGPLRRLRRIRLRWRVGRTVIPIWFNAWQYEGAKQIWAGLTHQITQAMEQSMPQPRRLATRVGYSIRRQGAKFWLGMATPLLIAALLSALTIKVGLAGGLAALLPKQAGLLAKAVPVLVPVFGALYVMSRFFKQVKPVSEGLLDYVRQPNYREHMGYQHQVLDDIRYLNGRLRRRRRSPRVVVFIDDLDRCSDEKVLETLQAINLLLTASGCYVFLGIDTEMIIRAIQRHYDFATDPQDKARSYLRKILQINVRLQPPAPVVKAEFLDAFFSAKSRQRLAEASGDAAPALPEGAGEVALPWDLSRVGTPHEYALRLDTVEDTTHELWAFRQLAELVPTNPRELKRLVNVHRLVKLVLKGAGIRPSSVEQRLLVGWLLFCFDQPMRAAVLVARARREAEAGGPEVLEQPAPDDRLAAIIARLADDPTAPDEEQRPSTLTYGQLLPGTQYAEAWEVSSLFRLS